MSDEDNTTPSMKKPTKNKHSNSIELTSVLYKYFITDFSYIIYHIYIHNHSFSLGVSSLNQYIKETQGQ